MAAIIDTALFIDVLVRIGFNTVTADEIVANGFDTINVFQSQEDEDIGDLVRHIGRWHGQSLPTHTVCGATIAPAPVYITLTFLSIGRLKAMSYWVLTRTR